MSDPRIKKFGLAGFNKPKRTPSPPKKSHVVLAKEGDKVKLDGEEAVVIKIGMTTSVFGVTAKDGYTWRYVPNQRIDYLKLEKIIDKDLHVDSTEEKKAKLEKILRGEADD